MAGDTSNIATANLTVPIVNGVLKCATGSDHYRVGGRAI